MFNRYRNNSCNLELKRHLKSFQVNLNTSIESSKHRCYSRIAYKLNSTQKNSKSYSSLLKIFLNNKKVPLILPLCYENCFITDFNEKAERFNCIFSKKCSFMVNHSELPTSLSWRTNKRSSSVTFSAESIWKIIQGLNPNEAQRHNNISICILKICGDTIFKPLEKTVKPLPVVRFHVNVKNEILSPFTKQ